MYKEKTFRIKSVEEVKSDLYMANRMYGGNKKVFLADGDALIRNTHEQLDIFKYIKSIMPQCERITCYASPKSILSKSFDELVSLREAGLSMVYLGVESGSDEVLKKINKGVTANEIIEASKLIKKSGIKLSVTAIIGLGGRKDYKSHGVETGKILSKINADYIGLLTLMLEEGTEIKAQWDNGKFEGLSQREILMETRIILENLDSPNSIFRANHASNYLNLKGTLNKDRARLLEILDEAIEGNIHLKEEQYRGL